VHPIQTNKQLYRVTLIYCCKRRSSSTKSTKKAGSPTARSNGAKHPFGQLEDSSSNWSLNEKSPTLSSYSPMPLSPLPRRQNDSLSPHPQRPALVTRSSAISLYSQDGEDEIDRFVAPINSNKEFQSSQQRSTFHLPSRTAATPYSLDQRTRTPDWI